MLYVIFAKGDINFSFTDFPPQKWFESDHHHSDEAKICKSSFLCWKEY